MWTDKLKDKDACRNSIIWSRRFDSLQAAWDVCKRGDWMLWLLGRLSERVGSKSRKKLVRTACACARLGLQYVPGEKTDVLRVIEVAERYVHGKASLKEVITARETIAFGAFGTFGDAAFFVTHAACYAAGIAYADHTAGCVNISHYASRVAAYVSRAAAFTGFERETLAQCAAIVRAAYPKAPKL